MKSTTVYLTSLTTLLDTEEISYYYSEHKDEELSNQGDGVIASNVSSSCKMTPGVPRRIPRIFR